MEKEKMEIVLEGLLEESKSIGIAIEELKQRIWQLKEKGEDIEKKLDALKLVVPPVDTGPVQGIIRLGFDRVQQMIAEQPRTVVHERRFLLFPEHHAAEYYHIIFRVILWLTMASSVYYLFALGKQALQNHKEVRLRELELTYAQKTVRPLLSETTETGKQKTTKVFDGDKRKETSSSGGIGTRR